MSIAGARKTLYITNWYFAPERSFIELLAAAARRGVDVRILTAGPRLRHEHHVAQCRARVASHTLLEAGVRVFEWQPSTLHAKTLWPTAMVHDRMDANFDNRSMALNDEST